MLENLLATSLLFGQRNTLERYPTTADTALPMLFALALIAMVAMALVVALIQYRQRRLSANVLNSPSELWAELCRVHQLDKADSTALRELAEARALQPAASVFVREDLWQLERNTPEINHLRPQLQRLQSVLFAGLPEEAKVV
jgi:hypothetical protein